MLLQAKSINVEDAANELINMLCTYEPSEEEGEEKDEDEKEDLNGASGTQSKMSKMTDRTTDTMHTRQGVCMLRERERKRER